VRTLRCRRVRYYYKLRKKFKNNSDAHAGIGGACNRTGVATGLELSRNGLRVGGLCASCAMRIYRVLLVEDEAESADIIKRHLTRFNFYVDHVTDGRLANHSVRRRRYDLILCDIMMPQFDGFMFLESSAAYLASTPVIMVTALHDRETVLRSAQLHAGNFLVKPVTHEQLMERVLSALGLTPDDLIARKAFPFSMLTAVRGEGRLRIRIDGCPDGRAREAAERLLAHEALVAPPPSIRDVTLDVEAPLALDQDYLGFLEFVVQEIMRVLHIRARHVELCGSLFDTFMGPELTEHATLGQCSLRFAG
jgi:DNA-binding response OmpR family regulator